MVEIIDTALSYLVNAQLAFVNMAGQSVWDMIIFTLGIAVYAIFIWHFYKYIARRDVFKWDMTKYEISGVAGRLGQGIQYFFKYLVLYPVLVFVWFGVFASFIFVLGSLETQASLVVAFAMVGAIRLTAYYNQDISVDLGKLLPLAMLGVFILQLPGLEINNLSDRFFNLGLFADDILKFTAVAVVLEWVLRLLYSVKHAISESNKEKGSLDFKKIGK